MPIFKSKLTIIPFFYAPFFQKFIKISLLRIDTPARAVVRWGWI